ncbi:MAG: type IV pilus modification PilV family protein [Parashewanella sp.]
MKIKANSARTAGFTLIELVAGMIVISAGLVAMSAMLLPQTDRAASHLHSVRAAELAQSVMNEIWGKQYDPNTGFGGIPACKATGTSQEICTLNASNSVRDNFANINDYKTLTINSPMLGSSQTYADVYKNYKLQVAVASSSPAVSKRITVTVTTPEGTEYRFDAVRSNY